MYNIHIIENQKENTVPVTLTIIKNGNKLLMVKAVKWFTGLGLRESKDIIDMVDKIPQIIKKYATTEEIIELRKDLSTNSECLYTIDTVSESRNKKLIELGLGTKQDYIDDLVEKDLHTLISKRFDYNELKKVLTERYSLISKENLEKIYESN